MESHGYIKIDDYERLAENIINRITRYSKENDTYSVQGTKEELVRKLTIALQQHLEPEASKNKMRHRK